MSAQPLCHTMLVSEITPTVDVGACMRVLHKSQWGIPAERIYLHKLWFVRYACDILWYIVLLLCKTRYDGECTNFIHNWSVLLCMAHWHNTHVHCTLQTSQKLQIMSCDTLYCQVTKGTPHRKKIDFFRALPEKGGGAPYPNFLPFFTG